MRGGLVVVVCLMLGCQSGTSGANGSDGTQGIQGPKGDKGEKGDKGDPAGSSGGGLYQSGSRLKAKVATTPDGSKEFQGWYDAQLQADCTFLPTSNEERRCLPNLPSRQRAYADAACTQLIGEFSSTCGIPTELLVMQLSSTCAGTHWTYEIRTVGAANPDPDIYYDNNAGGCYKGARTPTYEYRNLSAPKPLTGYVMSTTSVE